MSSADDNKDTCSTKESCCCSSGKKCNCARNLVIVLLVLGVASLIWWLTKK